VALYQVSYLYLYSVSVLYDSILLEFRVSGNSNGLNGLLN